MTGAGGATVAGGAAEGAGRFRCRPAGAGVGVGVCWGGAGPLGGCWGTFMGG